MLRRCAQISLTCPHGISKLFGALVLPILSYGYEVWIWDHRVGARATTQAESLHAQFLRRLLGVHRHAHGSDDTAPSRERHEQQFRYSQAATVTTYLQMRGPSTA
eukprot:jgi/Astpho2/6543/Aster-07326